MKMNQNVMPKNAVAAGLAALAALLMNLTGLASPPTINFSTVNSAYAYQGSEDRNTLAAVIANSPLYCNQLLESATLFAGQNTSCGFVGSDNFGYYLDVKFNVSSLNAGAWSFRLGADFGRGGAIFVDGVKWASRTDNIWWGLDWNTPGEIMFVNDVNLSEGSHRVEVIGFEDCCAGQMSLQFQIGASGWQAMTVASLINPAGAISVREYRAIQGNTLDDLYLSNQFPDQPDLIALAGSFEWPEGSGGAPPSSTYQDNYGVQLRGFLNPPVTGDYVFYIASDDNSALWLSTDENPVNKALIAVEPQWNPVRAFATSDHRDLVDVGTADERYINVSKPISLAAGKQYYIEAQMKQGGGGANLAVAWKTPGGPEVQDGSLPLPGAYLSPYNPSGPAFFIKQPSDHLSPAGSAVTLECAVAGTPPFSIQWQRNGLNIPGANGLSYSIPSVTTANNGERYTVIVQNNVGANTIVSREAILSVYGPNVNGSIYEFVLAADISWDDANAAAQQRSFNGKQGHLATITSFTEDTYIESLREKVVQGKNLRGEFWVGGFQLPDQGSPGAGWMWVNGEGAIPGANGGLLYSDWHAGEPNDWPDGIENNQENHLAIGLFGGLGWNDESGGVSGYVVEYDYADNTPPVIQCPSGITVPAAPGSCSARVNFSPSATDDSGYVTVSCSPPSGSAFPGGTTTVTCTASDASGNIAHCSFTVTVIDTEKPVASCVPTTNPSGNNTPAGGGFYQLLAVDNCDSTPALFVADSASGFVAGPYKSGDKVKLIQAPGVTPNSKPMAGGIVSQIQLKGDALIYAVDASGNISARVSCSLAPKQK